MSLLDTKQSNDAKRYKGSSEDLSYRELRLAKWYIRNKTRLLNVGIGVLLLVSIATIGYSTIAWIGYLAIGMQRDDALTAVTAQQFQDYTAQRRMFAPESLMLDQTFILPQGGDARDLITAIRNPNTAWIATVQFRYVDGTDTPRTYRQLILPHARALLADLGAPVGSARVTLDVRDIDWQRIDNHRYPDPLSYMAPRINFLIQDLDIRSFDASLGTPAMVSFRILNDSAYGYWDGDFLIAFYSGESIVAVRPLHIDQFRAGRSELVEFNFGSDRLNVTDVELLPNINVFDSAVYLPVR